MATYRIEGMSKPTWLPGPPSAFTASQDGATADDALAAYSAAELASNIYVWPGAVVTLEG